MDKERDSYYTIGRADTGIFFRISDIIIKKKTNFQDAIIAISPIYGKCMILDDLLQVSQSGDAAYHESMIHPTAVIAQGPVKRALILGGGDGCALRELLKYKELEKAVIVDLDGEVVQMSREHLNDLNKGSLDDPRADVIIGDAVKYVNEVRAENEAKDKGEAKDEDEDNSLNHENECSSLNLFDLIVMDLVDAIGDTSNLASSEFFNSCKALLSPGGALVTHGDFSTDYPYASGIKKKLEGLFKYARMHISYIPSFGSQWAFIVCSDSCDPATVSNKEAEKKTHGIDLRHYIPKAHNSIFMLNKETLDTIKNFNENKYKKEVQKEVGKIIHSCPLEEK